MSYIVTCDFKEKKMDDRDDEVSIVDVYDMASDIGKEFERVIDVHGRDSVSNLIPSVVGALERLETLAMKNERENTIVQDLKARIAKLETEKQGKAEERQRFEAELEQIEDHWKQESRELMALVTRLQEENKKLSAIAQQLRSPDEPVKNTCPEVDIAMMQNLKAMVEKQREQLRAKDKELTLKTSELDTLTSQVERLTAIGKEWRRKQGITQNQIRTLLDERADFLAQLKDQQQEISSLKLRLGLAEKENEDLSHNALEAPDLKNKAVYDLDDPNRPRFTTVELKEILLERNQLKARVSDLEDELESCRPAKSTKNNPEETEDAPVQGPLPCEPDDAPWKKTESGVRRFFRKLFSEPNLVTSSPRRSLSTLSKLALSGTAGETSV